MLIVEEVAKYWQHNFGGLDGTEGTQWLLNGTTQETQWLLNGTTQETQWLLKSDQPGHGNACGM